MEIKVSKVDILSGYIAQLFQYGTGIIVLPAILNRLSPEEIGLNYIMLAVGAMTNIAEFGFSGIIGRNVTYVLSGANTIYRGQIEMVKNRLVIDYKLLKVIIDASKYLFTRISLVCLLLLLTLGSLYIYNVSDGFSRVDNAFIIWVLYSIGIFFNIYFLYYNALLKGRALLKEQRLATIYSRLAYIVICFVMLFNDLGLMSVVVANLISPFIARYYSYKAFYSNEMVLCLPPGQSSKAEVIMAIRNIWYTAKKSGITTIGHYIATNGGTFIAGLYLPLAATAQWGLMTQFFSILQGLAMNLTMSYYPEYCKYSLQDDNLSLIRKSSFAIVSMILLLIIGGLLIIIYGGNVLIIVKSRTSLPVPSLMTTYLLVTLIVSNAQAFAMLMTARNVIPSPKAVLTTSIGQLAAMLFLLQFTDLGLWALLLGSFVCGMAYIYWAWMKMELNNLQISVGSFYYIGLREIIRKCGRI